MARGVKIPFGADGKAYKRGLSNMRKETKSWSKSIKGMFKDALSFAMGQTIFASASKFFNATTGAAKGFFTSIVKGAADMETLQTSFEVLLGSGNKAVTMMDELKKRADATPFTMPTLADGTKTLLQYGVAAEEVLEVVDMLGDISGGNAQKFQSLTIAFGQMSSTGRLMGQDLLQMINAGFNPLMIISQKTGENMADLKKRMEQGGVSVGEVTEAFKMATSEGGRFFGMLAKQSETFTGLLSTLEGAWESLKATLGKPVINWLKPMIEDWIVKVKELTTILGDAFDAGKGLELFWKAWDAGIETLKEGIVAAAQTAANLFSSALTEAGRALVRLLPGGDKKVEALEESERRLAEAIARDKAKRDKKAEAEKEIARRNKPIGADPEFENNARGRLRRLMHDLAVQSEVRSADRATVAASTPGPVEWGEDRPLWMRMKEAHKSSGYNVTAGDFSVMGGGSAPMSDPILQESKAQTRILQDMFRSWENNAPTDAKYKPPAG